MDLIFQKYSNGKVLCMDEVEFRLCNNNKDEIKGLIEKKKDIQKTKHFVVTCGKKVAMYLKIIN